MFFVVQDVFYHSCHSCRGNAVPLRSIKSLKVIAAAPISQRFLISLLIKTIVNKNGVCMHQALKYRVLLPLDCVNTSLANQAVQQNQQKFFSPFAVDKPVEKQTFFELPHCFLTKNYDLPKK